MSRLFHVWWLLVIALIIGAIIVVYGIFNTGQQLYANTLYDAVRFSADYARDDSARESRGTYVINTDAFMHRLSQYHIRDFGDVGDNSHKHDLKMYVHFLADNQATNDINHANGRSQHFVRNGYVDSTNYHSSDSASHDNNDIPRYMPIRAIQVQAAVSNRDLKSVSSKYSKNPNNITNVGDKYVATLVVQDQKAVIKGKNMTTTDLSKLSRYTSDSPKYADNDPITKPNQSKKNAVDLTDPSYQGENGHTGAIDTNDKFQIK